ncbi:MAG: hypothetical protein IKF56_03850 [Eggerthellaceae bacterium]|nr:hypothetical protein [Eggerthellaceae bacterium]
MTRMRTHIRIALCFAFVLALMPGKAFASTGLLHWEQSVVSWASAGTAQILPYDFTDIKAIGTQEDSGHDICCPSFACAYADAVLDGTVNDHEYYTCSNCTWTDWGGGDSSDRFVGSDEQLLREAYDQISAGKPTVIHVAGSSDEHWITLIGYKDAVDPDHLTLSNFIALDPWDGTRLNAGSKYSLYGDGCEHVSSR